MYNTTPFFVLEFALDFLCLCAFLTFPSLHEIYYDILFVVRCYYALQGIHNQRYSSDHIDEVKNVDTISLHPDGCLLYCKNDTERETERLLWRKYLGKILPASFRIGKDVPTYYKETLTAELGSLLQKAHDYVPEPEDETEERVGQDPRTGPLKEDAGHIQALTFSPYSYQLSGLDRATIRKNPALEELHVWLKQQVAAGYVTRQETVSMIPPILLNVMQTDTVLDMCAAPGSKTSQLLEDLSCNTTYKSSDEVASTSLLGCLVANDASVSRACMLVSQLRRILHNHPVALVTAVNAQYFPSDVLQFDKILCDVPCSGDGTTRKNINVWNTWSASGALALHSLQLSIAMKGAAQLLKVGGLMVYSTCSLNPIENEAVVAELLRQGHGALELVDYHHPDTKSPSSISGDVFTNGPLPGFRTRPGMTSWKVLCEDLTQRQLKNREKKNNAKMQKKRQAFENGEPATSEIPPAQIQNIECIGVDEDLKDSGDSTIPSQEERSNRPTARKFEPTSLDEIALLELAESEGLRYYQSIKDVPSNLNRRIRASAFPPTPDERQSFRLERCIRCLPQDNNTGGFFVALLRKVDPWSATDRRHNGEIASCNSKNETTNPDSKRPRITESDTENTFLSNNNPSEEDEVDVEALEGLDADNVPIRGNVKNNGVQGNDEFGKDDFAAVREELMEPLIEHYGLSNGFDKSLYMARACSDSKIIYYVGRPVKQLFDLGMQKRVTIVNTGLKGFMRNNRNVSDCAVTYRVCQEGIHFLVPYMTKRKYVVSKQDFRTCLLGEGKTIHLSRFSHKFRNEVKEESVGSIVVLLDGYEDQLDQKLVVCMWKCRGESIDSLVAKVEIDALLSKLDAMEKIEVSA
jgi:16S rRNA C967 or C1407 C5-methylase (RsmB/RsmF family)